MIDISVVVTAYNREEFLPDSLNSLVNQTLDKDKFEVILITNFDYDISPYNSLNIKQIKMEGKVGEYMHKALHVSRGSILCFLDDDDIFVHSKLELLLLNFSTDTIYYKHAVIPFKQISELSNNDPDYTNSLKPIRRKDYQLPYIYAYNRTSIALRKTFILKYADGLQKLDVSEDWFFFLAHIEAKGQGLYDKNILSFYRKHQSVSNKAIYRSDSNYKSYVGYLTRLTNSFVYMKEVFKNPEVLKLINYQLSVFRFRTILLEGKTVKGENKNDLVNLLKASLINYNEFWIIKLLFVRAFISYYFPKLSDVTERVYASVSRKINYG